MEGEEIQGEERQVSPEKVYVALGRKVKENERNLRYALRAFKHSELVLLHIHKPSDTMPGPMGIGKMPTSSVTELEVRRFREGEREKMKEAMGHYLRICAMEKAKADELILEASNIQKGIVQLVSEHSIRRLVMGAANDKSFSKNMSHPSSNKARYVNLEAAVSCHIWFVCKGLLICSRDPKNPPARIQSERNALPPRTNKLGGRQYMSFPGIWSPGFAGGVPSLVRDSSSASSVISCESECGSSSETMLTRDVVEEGELQRVGKWEEYVGGEKCSAPNMVARKDSINETNPILQILEQKVKIDELLAKNDELQERTNILEKQLHELTIENKSLKKENMQLQELSTENQSLIERKNKEDMTEMQRQLDEAKLALANAGSSGRRNYLEFKSEELKAATHNFNVDKKIGQGGFGTVYRGNLYHTEVAIKRFNPNNTHDGQAQFQQEIDALTRVRHPRLVALIGACCEEQCLVYEFVENGSLQDRLFGHNTGNPLSCRDRLRIAAEICQGIMFLHSASIVHGDLKPHNILLDDSNRVKIADFGICRFLPEPQRESAATVCRLTDPKGTGAYMDPEFMSTKELTYKSDVYALGVIIFQLLTRKLGFGLRKVVEDAMNDKTLYRILDDDAGKWDFRQANKLATLALQCCEVNRRCRPNLKTEVWKILEAYL